MCFNCFTGAETLVAGGAGAAGIAAKARVGFRMLLGRTTVTDLHQQALANYQKDSAFIASLGHDPGSVLGPPPALPANAGIRATSRPSVTVTKAQKRTETVAAITAEAR